MQDFPQSMKAYEAWLKQALGGVVDRSGLARKHKKMADGPFPFLRGTYWRYAETLLVDCPEIAKAPPILAVGDIHAENFGTWRDAEGRLVWGINDFDEAARMPYAADLVRLATSLVLAGHDSPRGAKAVCRVLLEGYREGLDDPQPIVIESTYGWLRKAVMRKRGERKAFWDKMEGLSPGRPPKGWREALAAAMPEPRLPMTIGPRLAGTGSLGRPRYVAVASWRGGPVVREAKALVPSAWCLAHKPRDTTLKLNAIAGGAYRAPDPHYGEANGVLVRRLSPNNRKIEVETGLAVMLSPRLIHLMWRDLAACHAGDTARAAAVRKHAATLETTTLAAWVEAAKARVMDDHAAFMATLARRPKTAQKRK